MNFIFGLVADPLSFLFRAHVFYDSIRNTDKISSSAFVNSGARVSYCRCQYDRTHRSTRKYDTWPYIVFEQTGCAVNYSVPV